MDVAVGIPPIFDRVGKARHCRDLASQRFGNFVQMPSPRETVGLTVCVKETRSQTFKTLKPFIFSICCDGYSFYIADPEERPVCLLQRWKDCLTLRRVTLATVILMS